MPIFTMANDNCLMVIITDMHTYTQTDRQQTDLCDIHAHIHMYMHACAYTYMCADTQTHTLTAPALALTTSVPAFCILSVNWFSSSSEKVTAGCVCSNRNNDDLYTYHTIQ